MQIPRYENKPFKKPRMVGTTSTRATVTSVNKNTLTTWNAANTKVLTSNGRQNSIKRPMPATTASSNKQARINPLKYFTITFRKQTMKKNKTWDGDGYAVMNIENFGTTHFYSDEGRRLGKTVVKNYLDEIAMFENIFKCGSWEFQFDYEVTENQEIHRIDTLLGKTGNKTDDDPADGSATIERNKVPPPVQIPISQLFVQKNPTKFRPVVRNLEAGRTSTINQNTSKKKYLPIFDSSKIENPLIMNKSKSAEVDVIVDPVLNKSLRPHQREGIKFMYDCIMGLQRANGVKGSEESLLLEEDSDVKGCLLADEMGLGKTLMTITLIWTLLKQTPQPSKVSCSQFGIPLRGLCQKIMVVCPVTLIGNWKKEFMKWLTLNRIGVLTLSPKNTPDKDRSDVRNFLRVQRTYQVLIIGYEKLLSVTRELEMGKECIDLLVCDEGHRLKNSSSKVLNFLASLDIQRKVLLSGTPIQNDLNEFYTIIDFINPGILGNFSQFKREFITPITRARDVNNKFNQEVVDRGEEKSEELIEITKKFILRRTNSIMSNYLPPKTDLVLFCKPTTLQIKAFKNILLEGQLDFTTMTFNSSLGLITLFKKICNSPSLINGDSYYFEKIKACSSLAKFASSLNSGKLKVLMALLSQIKHSTDGEKVVIISNYTQTLDIIQDLMRSANLSFVRLDGSTPNKQRDSIVNSFNRNPSIFGFLLSAKSGGVGLNLIGASRLVLFDNDWNPSVDLQAMSRIHRDGQKKPCFIYRLVTSGCIDEKIFQRQLMKNNLSKKFLDDSKQSGNGKSDDNLFNQADLKDLFSIHTSTKSNTHELICSCEGLGEEFEAESVGEKGTDDMRANTKGGSAGWVSALEVKDALEQSQLELQNAKKDIMKRCLVGYKHIDPANTGDLIDEIVNETLKDLDGDITFAFIKSG